MKYWHNKYGLIATSSHHEGVTDLTEVLPFTVIIHDDEWAQLGVYKTRVEAQEAIVEYKNKYGCETKATIEDTLEVLSGGFDRKMENKK
jgi:hypothetical protein